MRQRTPRRTASGLNCHDTEIIFATAVFIRNLCVCAEPLATLSLWRWVLGGLMKLRNRVAGAVASACVLVWAVTASASTVLSDGDFSGTITVGSHSGDPLGSAGGSPCGLCGNPLGGLFASVSYPAGAGTSISDVGFIDGSLAYNPGVQGAIGSINASYDRLTRANFAFNVPFNFRLVIEQGGVDYVTAINQGGSDTGGAFHNLSASGLTANSFTQFDFVTGIGGSAHPDFTTGAMLFGVMALTQTGPGQTFDAIFDNINITVNETPLPAAFPLFASGLGALGLLGWRRKRKASLVPA